MKRILSFLFCTSVFFFALTPRVFAEDAPTGDLTFSMIKPNAVRAYHTGTILHELEKAGFTIVAMKMTAFDDEKVAAFYAEHKEKPFFKDLVNKMTSGPIVAVALKSTNAVTRLRTAVGSTDPQKADPMTIRARFGENITENAIHASDSDASAKREIDFFFSKDEIFLGSEK